MGKPKVFIDGSSGTAGLRIREWLEPRQDIQLLEIDSSERKSLDARKMLLNEADLAILCLPDDAAIDAVRLIENEKTRVLDASTAHRVAPGWVYGLPEMGPAQREAIGEERRVSNPGCYPSAVILAIRPLVDAVLLPGDAPIAVHALSGYSGGGRRLIEKWEDPETGLLDLSYEAPYALDTVHKHIPEMTRYAGLDREPHFVPAVGPFRCGMRVEIPLHESILAPKASAEAVHSALSERYAAERFIRVMDTGGSTGSAAYDEHSFDPRECNDTNRLEIAVVGNPLGHVLLLVRLDNLGKGASGAAVQNLNLMLGFPEETDLPA